MSKTILCRNCHTRVTGLADNEYIGSCPVCKNSFATDPVAHPSHYNQGKIEVIEFIEDQKLDFHLGNTVKYCCRAGIKDPSKELEDLKKAFWYLARKIELISAAQDQRDPIRPNEMVKK